MLSGEFYHKLDAKNRLFIPAKHREELGDSFMIVISSREKCLRVYSMSEWEKYIEPILRLARKDYEKVARTLHRSAAQVEPDDQGRVVLPPALVKHAEIIKNAVVVGCGYYSEIWSEEAYNRVVEEENLDDINELLEAYGL